MLEASGVCAVKEVATRYAANLTAKIAEVDEQLNLAGRVPNHGQVAAWIAAARDLAPKVND